MAPRNFRIETCAICLDNFEWISLFEDEEYEQVLLALSKSALEPSCEPEGSLKPTQLTFTASTSSASSSRSRTMSFSMADDGSAALLSKDKTNQPVSKGNAKPPKSVDDTELEEDAESFLTCTLLCDEGDSVSSDESDSASSDDEGSRGVGAFSSSITTTFDPQVPLTLGCSLPCDLGHLFCGTCLETYIETQLKDGVWPIVCPEHRCDEAIPAVVVESFLGTKANRWYELGVERAVMKQVYCPNPECNKLIDVDGWDFDSDVDKTVLANSTCPYCRKRFCAMCKEDPHAGKTCKQIHEDTSQKSFDTLATQKGWKRCPGCNYMVEKTTGCNHMTCRCSRQFCYVCPSGAWPCRQSH